MEVPSVPGSRYDHVDLQFVGCYRILHEGSIIRDQQYVCYWKRKYMYRLIRGSPVQRPYKSSGGLKEYGCDVPYYVKVN